MTTTRNTTTILINREQPDQIRQIQEEERRGSPLGIAPGIHAVARRLMAKALLPAQSVA